MPRFRAGVLLVWVAVIVASTSSLAADRDQDRPKGDDFVSDVLGRSIIGPRQTLAEVADYVETHIPRMPEVKTVEAWEDYARWVRSETFGRVIFRGQAEA